MQHENATAAAVAAAAAKAAKLMLNGVVHFMRLRPPSPFPAPPLR